MTKAPAIVPRWMPLIIASVLILSGAIIPVPGRSEEIMTEGVTGGNDTATTSDVVQMDVRQAIRDYFTANMPTSWYISDPWADLGGFSITLHIPDSWKGNPVAAAMNLCPDHDSQIWQATPSLIIRPFFHQRPWPTYHCHA